MRCTFHPDVETDLLCSKCGRPICPNCLVQTPVGARCRDCASLKRLPTFQVRPGHYLRAVGTALGLAILSGIAWGLINGLMHFSFSIYLNLLLALGVGYVIGEVTSLSVNRKRSRPLMIIGGTAVLLSYLIGNLAPWGFSFHLLDLAALALGIFIAGSRLR